VFDQQAEDAVAFRVRTYGGDLFVGDTVGDEPDQPFAIGADDAESAVPGTGEFAGGADDAVERAVQVQVGTDADHGVQQGPQPVLVVHDLVDPAEELLQEGIETYPGQHGELQRTLVPVSTPRS
jgi:hypothetical protein